MSRRAVCSDSGRGIIELTVRASDRWPTGCETCFKAGCTMPTKQSGHRLVVGARKAKGLARALRDDLIVARIVALKSSLAVAGDVWHRSSGR